MSAKTKSPLTRKKMQFNILLKELKLEHAKADMLAGYEAGSTNDLTEAQLDELIHALELQKDKAHRKDTPAPVRRLRHVILNLLADLGITNKGDQNAYWERVNKYLSQPRVAGKLLYQMDEKELEACKRKLHAIKKEVDRRVQEEKFWASNN